MGLGTETFTLLAVLEAKDMLSAVYENASGVMDKFTESIGSAADAAATAGSVIDESLLQTASGADALALASARVEAAEAQQAITTQALAKAEQDLLAAQGEAATAADGDTEAQGRLATALTALSDAQKEAATSAKTLGDAQKTQADTQAAAAAASTAATDGAEEEESGWSNVATALGGYTKAATVAGLAVAGITALSVKSAASFQQMTTVLQTSGGETADQMNTVRQGILSIADSTGTSTQQLTNGMYMIGSAGITGGKGLDVLTAAAQGAKAEGADLSTVSNALTTVMTNYYGTLKKGETEQTAANDAMNQMIAIVSNGKTTTEDLASSLSTVLPVAASAGISFSQVGGAIATMTGQGMSAQQATQDLANTIRSLQNPNSTAVTEMQELGLNANTVASDLGTEGLTGTLNTLMTAMQQHFGPSGEVVINTMKSSATAMQDAQTMIQAMPASLQTLATSFLNGSVSAQQWKTDLLALSPTQQKLMQQFATTAENANSFNNMLTKGTADQQTAAAALNNMMGGATGLNTALMLGANNGKTFAANVNKVAAAANSGKQGVSGWSDVQQTLNQKLSQAKEEVATTGIAIGTAMLPVVTKLMNVIGDILGPMARFISSHKDLTAIVLTVVAGLTALVGVVTLTSKVFKVTTQAYNDAKTAVLAVGRALGLVQKQQETATISTEAATEAESEGMAVRESVTEGIEGESWALEEEAGAQEEAAVASEATTAANEEQAASWLEIGVLLAAQAVKLVAVKTAQLAVAAASKVAEAAQWLWNAAQEASPMTWIITGIIALVAVFVLLWTKCAWFRDFWIDMWGDVEAAAEAVWAWLKQAFNDVVQWLDDAWNAIKSATMTLWDWFVDYITFEIDIVKTVIMWFADLGELFIGWFHDVENAVSDGVNTVVNWFNQLPSTIENLLSDAGNWLYNIGKDILTGLWNGITSGVGWLESQVKGLAGDVTGWFKSALGIFSPSLVMATEVGAYIPSGIAQGMTNNASTLNQAAKTVATGAVQSARTGVTGAALPLSTGNASAGGGVNLYLDLRNSSVMTDQDMTKLVNLIGRNVATKLLPQAGVRMNYR